VIPAGVKEGRRGEQQTRLRLQKTARRKVGGPVPMCGLFDLCDNAYMPRAIDTMRARDVRLLVRTA
jgi:predicted Zn-dependent protease